MSLAVVPYFFYDVGFTIFGSFLRYFCGRKLPAVLPFSPLGSGGSSYQQGDDYDRVFKLLLTLVSADKFFYFQKIFFHKLLLPLSLGERRIDLPESRIGKLVLYELLIKLHSLCIILCSELPKAAFINIQFLFEHINI